MLCLISIIFLAFICLTLVICHYEDEHPGKCITKIPNCVISGFNKARKNMQETDNSETIDNDKSE